MSWTARGGMAFAGVAVIRIESTHEFTNEPGAPCQVADELNDETFPSESQWLVLRPGD